MNVMYSDLSLEEDLQGSLIVAPETNILVLLMADQILHRCIVAPLRVSRALNSEQYSVQDKIWQYFG